MSAGPDTREPRTRRAVHALTGRHDVEYERAVPPRLDRTRQAAVHDCLFLTGECDGWFATVLPEALAELVDTGSAADCAAVAHTTGVAPAVRAVAAGAVGYERLPATFQALQPHHLREPEVLGAVVAAKRVLHRGPAMPVDRDVFEDVERWSEAAAAAGVPLPVDFTWMRERVRRIGAALRAAGRDSRPCHRDGSPSNVLVGPGREVRLVDFDFAGNADPHHDLAAMLVETCQLDDEWRRAAEVVDGRPDQQRLARYRLNAIADDLAVGTWALLAGARVHRPAGFTGYGQWRLLRCRYALRHRHFDTWLRRV
ncbi:MULTISPECIES: phosphotransferase family protein [unclassified Saccharopolyspora]|uniref:phosphotransferase family protein n=1 Tax=unclassified Saccharopolyspora TaxID=2646250 RepID=UPI001CD53229|nr:MULTISPECIES: aminoglycoside phosphotransferase family protein [unclassified Saccharopolyspora]MCA1188782.1 aminoglycoside phosphotransferase family protein [Saccharopolyspora sp. 6T]MCA1193889.1 aminoglycoside phosphotransferase family protein [Saccharopolyspora sp. 6V]MCA1226540.1 aminoglycoside phosphotransferase family protein [Saccharopolyspora sp. 6M]